MKKTGIKILLMVLIVTMLVPSVVVASACEPKYKDLGDLDISIMDIIEDLFNEAADIIDDFKNAPTNASNEVVDVITNEPKNASFDVGNETIGSNYKTIFTVKNISKNSTYKLDLKFKLTSADGYYRFDKLFTTPYSDKVKNNVSFKNVGVFTDKKQTKKVSQNSVSWYLEKNKVYYAHIEIKNSNSSKVNVSVGAKCTALKAPKTTDLRLTSGVIKDSTKKLLLANGTFYFDFNDQVLNYWSTSKKYIIKNYGNSTIKVSFQTRTPFTTWKTSGSTQSVAKGKTYSKTVQLLCVPLGDSYTETSARFKVEVSGTTEVVVGYQRYRQSKEVSLTNASWYWKPNETSGSGSLGIATQQPIAILYLNKKDAIDLGKILANENLHKKLNKVSQGENGKIAWEEAGKVIEAFGKTLGDPSEFKQGMIDFLVDMVVEMIGGTAVYTRLNSDLKKIGKELQNVTGPQTVYFNSGSPYYSISRQNSVEKASNTKYTLYGTWGYVGSYGPIKDFK